MKEQEITRAISLAVQEEMGKADPELVRSVVAEVVKALTEKGRILLPANPAPVPEQKEALRPLPTFMECARCRAAQSAKPRAVVTATGKNAPGIVARVSTVIAECGGDIQDISQTIIGEYFAMVIIVDLSGLPGKGLFFKELKERLLKAARDLRIEMVVMHEGILNSMHRV